MGGVGSAIAVVPIMGWLGVPLQTAKPTGLFINTLSMLSATLKNLKHGKLDLRFALPVVLLATVASPIGAYTSRSLPRRELLLVFALFLIYAGTVMLFFSPRKRRFEKPGVEGPVIGFVAGFLGGLLGVGGGAIITPTLIFLGHDPKKVVPVTSLVVFFSSLSGFLAYWRIGKVEFGLLITVSLSALAGGWLGTHVVHFKMSSGQVKRVLGIILYVIAVKTLCSVGL